MLRRIQTASELTPPATAIVGAARKSASWIDTFVDYTDNLHNPALFRKWAAIGTIAAVLEQKVWLQTSSRLYPNLYVGLIGHPGTGKTRTVRAARGYLQEIPEFHIAPTSLTAASLVDALLVAKRFIIQLPDPPLEYNSMLIAVDEMGTLMSKYDDEMIAILSAFYDPDPYGQRRRGNDLKITIKSPQLNILAGSTPSNLLKFMPEGAWDQGFTSRILFVFSDERIIGDDFADHNKPLNPDLIHDLKIINTLSGKYSVSTEYRDAVNNWRALGEPPQPNHPKLLHYNTRRRVHLYKLSIVAAAERSNTLLLTRDDFNRAMGWLLEAEQTMPDIFKAGIAGADNKAMDEIYHYVLCSKRVPEHKLIHFASEHVPAHSVLRVIEIMERSGRLRCVGTDKIGNRYFEVSVPKINPADLD